MAKALIPAMAGFEGDAYEVTLEQLEQAEKQLTDRIKMYGAASEQFAPVVKVLTVINDAKLWELHVDNDGEPEYRNFKQYVESFGWTQSVPRLYQLMREYRAQEIEAYQADPDGYEQISGINYDWEPRERTLGTTGERFARTQYKTLIKFVDGFEVAAHNIFPNDPKRADMIALAGDLKVAVTAVRDALLLIVDDADQAAAEAKEEKARIKAEEKAAKAEAKLAKAAADAEAEDAADAVSDDEEDDSLASDD